MLTKSALRATRDGLPIIDMYVYLEDSIVVWNTDGEVLTLRTFPNERTKQKYIEGFSVASA